jgi:hypothetical protein
MFTIELTSGSSWIESVRTIDRRKCDTISVEFAAAEALHWLLVTQKNVPGWGVTHYRVMKQDWAVAEGPTLPLLRRDATRGDPRNYDDGRCRRATRTRHKG